MSAPAPQAPTRGIVAVSPDGLLDHLLRDPVALSRRQAEADRVLAASGAGHLVHEFHARATAAGGRPWRIDPVPVVLDGATFDDLSAAVAERMRAFELILRDLYGPRHLVRDGVVAGEALSSSPRYRIATVGAPDPRQWLTSYAADVIRLSDGTWRLVQDLTDGPQGVGYALIDRSAMLRVADELLGGSGTSELASINAFPGELRHALAAATHVSSPRIVVFSGGVDHPGYVEHSALARTLGFTMVERPDLVVRQGRLWLRTIGLGGDARERRALDPIDVVYRRVDDDLVDPMEIGAPGGDGVPGLLAAVADGGVVLANAHGSGLIEDRSLASTWYEAADSLVGRVPSLPLLTAAECESGLWQYPLFRSGEVGAAPVVVRLHAVATPTGVVVMPGGNGRVLGPGDDPRSPTAQRAKDVWVLGSHDAMPIVVAPHLPQVDLIASIPTRAADALFWTGRAVERAEALARTVRVVASRRRQDPGLVLYEQGRWSQRMIAALEAARADVVHADPDDVDESDERPPPGTFAAIDAAISASTDTMVERLREFVTEAATVGEFFSTNTARSLGAVAQIIDAYDADGEAIDAIDDVLGALASFAGMWNESVVRGPAWRFGDLGIRIERSLVVLDLIAACATPDRPSTGDEPFVDIVEASSLEALLAANESLVAYRRRYRSDVEIPPTMHLLLHDADNPRGLAASLERLAEHVTDLEWSEGAAAVGGLIDVLMASEGDELANLGVLRAGVVALARSVADTWFATPVRPMIIRAGAR